jgi:hypothetical protein
MSLTAEKLDRRIRCRDDISERLEIPVLALINSRPVGPFFKLSKAFSAKAS